MYILASGSERGILMKARQLSRTLLFLFYQIFRNFRKTLKDKLEYIECKGWNNF